jgi:hypothetical protein
MAPMELLVLTERLGCQEEMAPELFARFNTLTEAPLLELPLFPVLNALLQPVLQE